MVITRGDGVTARVLNGVLVALGEELEVDIGECSPKGEGMARVQGLVIHVADAKTTATM